MKKQLATELTTKPRIAWVDVAKILGMFAIFVGHLTPKTGDNFIKWVFIFNVPLFFFLAGCMETKNQRTFFKNLLHKIKTILIPLYIFALATMLIQILATGSLSNVSTMGIQLYQGFVRNHSFGALWFLSCLFVMEIVFSLIKKLKKWYLIATISIIAFGIAYFVITPIPIQTPSWWWNVDSMLFYIPFFTLGYILYPTIQKIFTSKKLVLSIIRDIVGWSSIVYLVCLFMGRNIGGSIWALNNLTMSLSQIVRPLICIFAILFISKLLENSKKLSAAGRHTLIFCGGEGIARSLIISMCSLMNISIQFNTPLQSYIFALVEMAMVYFLLKPIFAYIFNKINSVKLLSKW